MVRDLASSRWKKSYCRCLRCSTRLRVLWPVNFCCRLSASHTACRCQTGFLGNALVHPTLLAVAANRRRLPVPMLQSYFGTLVLCRVQARWFPPPLVVFHTGNVVTCQSTELLLLTASKRQRTNAGVSAARHLFYAVV